MPPTRWRPCKHVLQMLWPGRTGSQQPFPPPHALHLQRPSAEYLAMILTFSLCVVLAHRHRHPVDSLSVSFLRDACVFLCLFFAFAAAAAAEAIAGALDLAAYTGSSFTVPAARSLGFRVGPAWDAEAAAATRS